MTLQRVLLICLGCIWWSNAQGDDFSTARKHCKNNEGVWIHGDSSERSKYGILTAKKNTCVYKKAFRQQCQKAGGTNTKCGNGAPDCYQFSGTFDGYKCKCGYGLGVVYSDIKKTCVCTDANAHFSKKHKTCRCDPGHKNHPVSGCVKHGCPEGATPIGGEACNCHSANTVYEKKNRACKKRRWSDYQIPKGSNVVPKARTKRSCQVALTLAGRQILTMVAHGGSGKASSLGGGAKARRSARTNAQRCFGQMMSGRTGKTDHCRYTGSWKRSGIKKFHPLNIRRAACKGKKSGTVVSASPVLRVFSSKGKAWNADCGQRKVYLYNGPWHEGFTTKVVCP